MVWLQRSSRTLRHLCGAALLLISACRGDPPPSEAEAAGTFVPTGQQVTPLAAPGAVFAPLEPDLPGLPGFRAGQAVSLAPSPDGTTLLLLTSGYNRNFDAAGRRDPALSNEYIFVYAIGAGAAPQKRQVLQIPNSFIGLAWAPDGGAFYASGGVDDLVHRFARQADGSFAALPPVALGHASGLGIRTKPAVAGIAVSPDGGRLLVANHHNDSVSLIDLAAGKAIAELDLRPGRIDPGQQGVAGGEYPYGIAWAAADKAYVTSPRDREVVALRIAGERLAVAERLKLQGQPGALLLDRAKRRLFVANDNSDSLAIVDVERDRLLGEIAVGAPAALLPNRERLKGANPNGLALAPDERTLFITLGGLNAVAVVALGQPAKTDDDNDDDDGDEEAAKRPALGRVVGLVPTGWYPNAVALDAAGQRLFVVNGKSDPGPNPAGCRDTLATVPGALANCLGHNQYVWQLEKGGLLSLPVPSAATLARLSLQVAANNNFPAGRARPAQDAKMAFLRQHIRHVVYVVKENRSYDQVLGDLEIGNGDPRLALLPERLSPNHHALARQFVTFDNFYDSGETSNTGWVWSTAARTTDLMEKTAPVNYAGRGLSYDSEGLNREVNVGIATTAERRRVNPATPEDPDLLPGTADVAAPDAADGAAGAGYLWDAALKAGKSLRNYGFFGDFTLAAPPLREPFKDGIPVFVATKPALRPVSDPYYRSYDMRYPDFWRVTEWARDFDDLAAAGRLPDLMLVRLPNDHFGSFGQALDGVGTVETQMGDNDYALGWLVARIAASPIAADTLILVVEDDAQAGADHVDAHRSVAFIIGPYVKRQALVSTRYTTVNMLRTIEEVLGLPPLGLNDGLAAPMSDAFDATAPATWQYAAIVPELLRMTELPLPPRLAAAERVDSCAPPRDARYWAAQMAGQDFSVEDRLDTKRFNAALWRGLKGEGAPPADRDGRDLRNGRAALLAAARLCRK
jgi:YVTN family beta-propeller protein